MEEFSWTVEPKLDLGLEDAGEDEEVSLAFTCLLKSPDANDSDEEEEPWARCGFSPLRFVAGLEGVSVKAF